MAHGNAKNLGISNELGPLNFMNINLGSLNQNFICKRFENSCP
jgi:hypothetical protein